VNWFMQGPKDLKTEDMKPVRCNCVICGKDSGVCRTCSLACQSRLSSQVYDEHKRQAEHNRYITEALIMLDAAHGA